MKLRQYLLIKLAEECNEVAQMASKCALFGYDSVDPREQTGETNLQKLLKELADLVAVNEMLSDLPDMPELEFDADIHIEQKKIKLLHYFKVSQEINR